MNRFHLAVLARVEWETIMARIRLIRFRTRRAVSSRNRPWSRLIGIKLFFIFVLVLALTKEEERNQHILKHFNCKWSVSIRSAFLPFDILSSWMFRCCHVFYMLLIILVLFLSIITITIITIIIIIIIINSNSIVFIIVLVSVFF